MYEHIAKYTKTIKRYKLIGHMFVHIKNFSVYALQLNSCEQLFGKIRIKAPELATIST